MKVLKDYDIKEFSTMKIGGSCRAIYLPESNDDIKEILNIEENPLIIGQMSNILITDKKFDRAIILLRENFSNIELKDDLVYAQAGATMNELSNFAVENALTGFEFMEGIPGSIGGGVFMNAGAYGGEMKDIIHSVVVFRDGEIVEVANEACEFDSRHSVFQDNGDIILGAYYKAVKGDREEIKALVDDLHERRNSKQPLEYPSCGSVFKRPKGYYASKLIDDLNLKGTRIGGAMVSPKHAGFIINYDQATFDDVIELIELIRVKVKDEYGVELETELRIIER